MWNPPWQWFLWENDLHGALYHLGGVSQILLTYNLCEVQWSSKYAIQKGQGTICVIHIIDYNHHFSNASEQYNISAHLTWACVKI